MSPVSRRRFLRHASLATAAVGFPAILTRAAVQSPYRNLAKPDRKLRIAHVGLGGKGAVDVAGCASEDLVAFCDVDFERGKKVLEQYSSTPRYRDFRQMLEERHREIDAVVVTTPDHMHFPIALMAIERGKHVYVQKPLTHTIGEARALKQAAARAGVVTQMGNQGHANDGTRILKEWIDAGVIGPVREVHCWTNRPVWPQGIELPLPDPTIPPTIDWNLWLGVAPERPFSSKIAPFNWRGFWDYGCGALGDMGCHSLDAAFWALNLRGSVRVSAVSAGATPVIAPSWSIVTYEFPARGSLPACKVVWYDGGKLPPVPEELGPGGKLNTGGVIYVGDKGKIMDTSDLGASPRLLPEARMQEFTARPPKILRRVPGGDPYREWIDACKGLGPAPGSNIVDHSADLTEMVLLGNVAIRAGKPITWDAARGACVGAPELTPLLHKNYRLF